MQKIRIGWREYIDLPDINLTQIKAKVDTGAKTSCLHAFRIEPFNKNKEAWVRFWIHPIQKDNSTVQQCEAKVIDQRNVRDSGGHEELRFVIQTKLQINHYQSTIEVTLSNRENMLFRMLLGRTAMTDFIVEPTSSFLTNPKKQL